MSKHVYAKPHTHMYTGTHTNTHTHTHTHTYTHAYTHTQHARTYTMYTAINIIAYSAVTCTCISCTHTQQTGTAALRKNWHVV